MRSKKKLWRILIGISCVFFLVLGFVNNKEVKASNILVNKEETAESNQMTMTITYGKVVKYGRNMGVYAKITNNGKRFKGKFCILTPDRNEKSKYYTKDIVIDSGETIEEELAIPVIFINGKLEFSIENEKKETVLKKSVGIKVEDNEGTLYAGILTKDSTSLTYLAEEELKTVVLNEDSFPKEANLLDMFDIIIINNYNTEKLNEKQFSALKQFVEGGGTLVLGTGKTGDKTIQLFEDEFRTDEAKNTIKQEISFGETKEKVIKKEVGRGNVCLFQFDLALDSKRLNTVGNKISSLIIKNISESKKEQIVIEENGTGEEGIYNLGNSLKVVNNDKVPKMGNYAIILAVYLLLIGPPFYFILKKIDKRNYIWISTSGFAIVFSILIFVLGSKTRLKEPIMNYLTISNITNNSVWEEAYFQLMAPFNRTYKVDIPKQYSIAAAFEPAAAWYSSNNEVKKDYDIEINSGEKENHIVMEKRSSFESANFKMAGRKKAERSLDCNLSFKDFNYIGTIMNNSDYPIKSGVALLGNKIYELGDIKIGETIDLEECNSYDFDIESVYNDEMIGKLANGEPYNNPDATVKRRFYAIKYYLSNHLGRNRNEIIGFAEQPKDSIIEDLNIKKEGVHMMVYKASVNYQNNKTVMVPDISSFYEVIQGDYTVNNLLSKEVTIRVQFEQEDKIKELYYKKELNPEILNSKNSYRKFYGEIFLFNFDKMKYEKVFTGGKEGIVKDLDSYIDKDNAMRMQIIPDLKNHEDVQITMPVLSVKKEVK